jgi:hypothetical protein
MKKTYVVEVKLRFEIDTTASDATGQAADVVAKALGALAVTDTADVRHQATASVHVHNR